MKRLLALMVSLLLPSLFGCGSSQGGSASTFKPLAVHAASPKNQGQVSSTPAARNSFPVIHVFVALCDNVNQGIVPVSPSLGNGDNPATNLYWGAAFGVKTFFSKSKEWELMLKVPNPAPAILERIIFKKKGADVFMVADAYRGKEISQTIWDFLEAASGKPGEELSVAQGTRRIKFHSGGSSDLIVYIGHDGLMDFTLQSTPQARDDRKREAIILACISQKYFAQPLKRTGAEPLLWTTNLMAPESYILAAAVDGWLKKESDEQIRLRAAKAYSSYQNCGLKAASNLFATGW